MSNHETFLAIAEAAFTEETLRMLEYVFKVVKSRYPTVTYNTQEGRPSNFPPVDSFQTGASLLQAPHSSWSALMTRVADSQLMPTHFENINRSLWLFAAGGPVDDVLVRMYLGLLRSAYRNFYIGEPIASSDRPISIPDNMNDLPWVLPILHDNTHWSFAVVYCDVLHWFDAQTPIPSPLAQWVASQRPMCRIIDRPVGVKEDSMDTGLLMLLGIRQLVSGFGILSQRAAVLTMPIFRVRAFIELLAHRLNPENHVFDRLLEQERRGDSTFFDEALGSPTLFVPEEEDGHTPHLDNMAVHRPTREDMTAVQTYPTSSQNVRNLPTLLDFDCKTILELLSEAVAFHRSTRTSVSTDLTILWSAVKNSCGSEFHRRLNDALLYEKFSSLGTDGDIAGAIGLSLTSVERQELQKVKRRSKIWYELCRLSGEFLNPQEQSTLLCVLPKGMRYENLTTVQMQEELDSIRRRLWSPGDPLNGYILQANRVVSALLNNSLPEHPILIDLYHLKRHQNLEQALFAAFTSLESNYRMALPRLS